MRGVTRFAATCHCGTLFGASHYLVPVQHPAAVEAGHDFALRCLGSMYARAAELQASLAAVACLAGIAARCSGAGRVWLAARILMDFVVLFTRIVTKPVNDKLFRLSGATAADASALLTRWTSLHWTRTDCCDLRPS